VRTVIDTAEGPAFERTSKMTVVQYAAAMTRRREIEMELAALFDQIDVLLTPTSAITAFTAEGPMPTEINGQKAPPTGAVPFAMMANLWGTPAASVPGRCIDRGSPDRVAHRWQSACGRRRLATGPRARTEQSMATARTRLYLIHS
jgi:hypothetical protein